MDNSGLRRLPERVYCTAAGLENQLNSGEPYYVYLKITRELLSSLCHALSEKKFESANNDAECADLCALVESTVSCLDCDDGMTRSIRSGLLEQRQRYANMFG